MAGQNLCSASRQTDSENRIDDETTFSIDNGIGYFHIGTSRGTDAEIFQRQYGVAARTADPRMGACFKKRTGHSAFRRS